MVDKKTLRNQMRHQRQVLSHLEQKKASQAIIESIMSLECYQLAQKIGLYHAFQNEVDLESLWVIAEEQGKQACFPAISTNHDNSMLFKWMRYAELSQFTLNCFQIKEPLKNSPIVSLEAIDCLFIPVVAFDKAGYRLGMGKGYYDRALANLKDSKPFCIGIAYDFQKVNKLPHESWDIPMDMIITESQIYSFSF